MAFTIHCTAVTAAGAHCAGLVVYQVDLPVYGGVGRVCEYHANHAAVNSCVGAIVDGDAFIPSAWLKPLEQPKDDQAETDLPPTPDTTVPLCSIGHPCHGGDRRARYRVISRGGIPWLRMRVPLAQCETDKQPDAHAQPEERVGRRVSVGGELHSV